MYNLAKSRDKAKAENNQANGANNVKDNMRPNDDENESKNAGKNGVTENVEASEGINNNQKGEENVGLNGKNLKKKYIKNSDTGSEHSVVFEMGESKGGKTIKQYSVPNTADPDDSPRRSRKRSAGYDRSDSLNTDDNASRRNAIGVVNGITYDKNGRRIYIGKTTQDSIADNSDENDDSNQLNGVSIAKRNTKSEQTNPSNGRSNNGHNKGQRVSKSDDHEDTNYSQAKSKTGLNRNRQKDNRRNSNSDNRSLKPSERPRSRSMGNDTSFDRITENGDASKGKRMNRNSFKSKHRRRKDDVDPIPLGESFSEYSTQSGRIVNSNTHSGICGIFNKEKKESEQNFFNKVLHNLQGRIK